MKKLTIERATKDRADLLRIVKMFEVAFAEKTKTQNEAPFTANQLYDGHMTLSMARQRAENGGN